MKRARDIREQLVGLMERVEIAMESCGDDHAPLRKAITAGYFANVAQLFKPSEGCFKTVKTRHSVYIHPGSGARCRRGACLCRSAHSRRRAFVWLRATRTTRGVQASGSAGFKRAGVRACRHQAVQASSVQACVQASSRRARTSCCQSTCCTTSSR